MVEGLNKFSVSETDSSQNRKIKRINIMPNYDFQLIYGNNPSLQRVLVLTVNQRSGGYSWAMYNSGGNLMPQGTPIKSGVVNYNKFSMSSFDLIENNRQMYGQLNLRSSLLNIKQGDLGDFLIMNNQGGPANSAKYLRFRP